MYDRPHYLFTFGGTAISGVEIWQSGFRVAPPADATEGDIRAALGQISVDDCFQAVGKVIGYTPALMAYSDSLVLRWAKVAPIKTNGKYAGNPKIAEGTIKGAATGARTGPAQLAWVATLSSGKGFGMAQKGRMYWPVPPSVGATVDPVTGAVTQAQCDEFRDIVATAIEDVDGEISTTLVPAFAAIMSSGGGVSNPSGTGTTNAIMEVGVGRILDTQRRRRNDLQEAYNLAPAAAGRRGTLYATPRRGQPAE
jgi:hypothetical protein